ncbi:hypothetical protein PInf_015986 [Phytophthora infestans]|nr:hypothetical protein PInf_015986 [Phytophthora infestans]
MPPGAIAAVAAVEAANQAVQQSRRRLSTAATVVKVMTARGNETGIEELTTSARGSLDRTSAIVKLSGHGDKTLALYQDGEMVTLGSSSTACSKDGGTDVVLSRMLLDVACGDKHGVGASEQGYLLTWGEVFDCRSKTRSEKETANAPRVVQPLLHKRIVQVACGASHSFALAEDGDVFSWGIGRSGALGHGLNVHEQTFDTVMSPMEVLALKGRRVVQIACGDSHTAALLQSGQLLTCGQRGYGRLGRQIANTPDVLDDEYSSWFGPVVFAKEGVKCTYVACGAAHTLVVAEAHVLYAFGWNSSGQLGVGDCRDRLVPTRVAYFDAVDTLSPLAIASVAAGNQHSLVSCPDGKLFAWGNDEMGQCGLNSCPQIYTLPHLVRSLIGLRVTQLAAGEAHSAVLTSHSQQHLETLERTQPIQYAQLVDFYESSIKDDTERRAQVFERARRCQLERAAAARRRKPPVDPATEALVKLLELQALVDQDEALDARSTRPQTARATSTRYSAKNEGDEAVVRSARYIDDNFIDSKAFSSIQVVQSGISFGIQYNMTLLDEYRRSIQNRTAPRSNQNRKHRTRQLTPLAESESGRRTPETLQVDNVPGTNQQAVQLTARQRVSKLRTSRNTKLQELSRGMSRSGPATSERRDKVFLNQDDSAPSRAHEPQRQTGRPALELLSQLMQPHRPDQNNNLGSALTDVPLQLLQGARVDLRRWSVIVSDQTLCRIAAHNHRITRTNLKAQKLQGLLAGSRQRSFLFTKEEAEKLSVSYSDARNQTTKSLLLTGADAITDAGLAAIALALPNLQEFAIAGAVRITDAALRVVSEYCTHLERLDLSTLSNVRGAGNRDFGLEGLRAIASKCSELRDLNLSGCFQLQERALVAIGASCCELRKLSLQACYDVTLVAVTAVLRGCQKLTKLDLSGVRRCDDRMLRAVAKYGSSITQLVVAGCDRVGDIGLRYLATRADQLELLDLTGCRLVSDAGLNALCDAFQRPKLAHLILADCSLITQDPIARLAFACPQLLTLSVHGCRISARVLQSLSSSWPFGELRLGTPGKNTQVGIFPALRAKDRRYVAEFGTSWAAAATIQNLFRARVARRQALVRREIALQHAVARRLQSIWRGRQARREALVLKMKYSRLEQCATLIQRRYRATRQARRAQNEMRGAYEKQLLQAVVLIQRRYRAMRVGREARRLVARRRREFMRETQAATKVQRHFRRRIHRNKLRLVRAQKLARSRQERTASVQIQRRYRGHKARRLAIDLREEQRRFFELQQRCAVRIQAQFRRLHARRQASRRRNAIIEREVAATKLQSVYRARRGREAAGLLTLARQRHDQDTAARKLQRHWRARRNRLALIIVAEARRVRNQQRSEAAVAIQRFVRKFLVRRRARRVVCELLEVQQRAEEMKRWAATLVQSYWRRHEAYGRVREERKIQRTRWKQLVDTYNQHGAGPGAPFFFCDAVVHGGGKRLQHNKRKLFDYYGRRRDFGDGEFPSIWPSEILQDASRGYDFVNLVPRDNYQEMLWEISQFVPVSTGNWDDELQATASCTSASSPAVVLAFVTMMSENTSIQPIDNEAVVTGVDGLERPAGPLNHLLYREKDVDEHGASLWESFYDYAQGEYRYYHRISKRVVSHPPG